jgi:phage-related protein (TIGR01555 family)
MWSFKRKPKAQPVVTIEKLNALLKVHNELGSFTPVDRYKMPAPALIEPPKMPPGVVPSEVKMAQDLALAPTYAYANEYMEGAGFYGFPLLIQLAQQPEYRKIVGVIAEEMTRKWVQIKAKGDDDKSERIAQLHDAMKKHKLREHFYELAIQDGFFGRSHLAIDVKSGGVSAFLDPVERKLPLIIDKAKIPKGSLLGFKTTEAMWAYPGAYNSDKPLARDFYNPHTWYIMGEEIHSTRFMTLVSQPVPDVLKPAYAFAGMSMIQIAMPYVGNWLRTRDSVSDLVNGFSVPVFKTNMTGALTGAPGTQEQARVGLFQKWRNNFGVWVLNMGAEGAGDAEDFDFKNVPLSGLDKLQAQAQEQMSSISSIPLVKLLGVTPSGLNASSDGEVRVFYDHIHARQERFFRPALERCLQIIQLDLWGEIDEDLEVSFEPLWQMDGLQAAQIRQADAQTADIYINDGALMPEEVRQAIADDPDSPFHSIDTSVVPEPPEPTQESDQPSGLRAA